MTRPLHEIGRGVQPPAAEVEPPASTLVIPAGGSAMAVEAHPWRCFFCDEVFTDRRSARLHFGADEDQQAGCRIKGSEGGLLRLLRETEDALYNATAALHAESADGLTAWRAALSRHAEAIRLAEELGYARGLADGRGSS